MSEDVRYARFGRFTFDFETLELTAGGQPVSLRPQPARVLALLVQNAGRLVTRQHLHQRLWPDSVVDYEKGLNTAVRQVRDALSDNASAPTFVETLPRRGYRFLAAVTVYSTQPSPPLITSPAPAPETAHRAGALRRARPWAATLAASSLIVAAWLALSTRDLETTLTTPVPLRVTSSRQASLDYLKARHFLNGQGRGTAAKAKAYFEQTVRTDPLLATARSGLAEASLRLGDLETARRAARQALEREPALAEAHRVLGAVLLVGDRDVDAARPHFEQAISAAPSQPKNHLAYAFYLFMVGNPEAGIVHARQAFELDPLSAAVNGEVGLFHLWADQPEEAAARCSLALEIEAQHMWASRCLITALERMGRHREALPYLRQLMTLEGADTSTVQRVVAGASQQAFSAYRAWRIQSLEGQAAPSAEQRLQLARLYAAEGRVDRALLALELAASDPPLGFAAVRLDPVFRPLANHPRFRQLLAAL